MTRVTTFKRGDPVSVREVGFRKTTATYWYTSCAGKHVVFMTDALGEYVRFVEPGSVEIEAVSQPGTVSLPEWAR